MTAQPEVIDVITDRNGRELEVSVERAVVRFTPDGRECARVEFDLEGFDSFIRVAFTAARMAEANGAVAVSTDQAALERVRVIARRWAELTGDGLSIALDRRMGEAVLSTIRDDNEPPASRLARLTQLASGWLTPGNTLFFPAAGQAVLDAIAGGGAAPATGTEG